MLILLLIVLFILLVPVLLLYGFFSVVTVGFEKLGIAPGSVLLLLILMFIGSFINIPLGRKRVVSVEVPHFFGLFKKTILTAQGLTINLGGAVIPVMLALYFLFFTPWEEAALATVLMIALAYVTARVVPSKGIVLPFLLPPLAAAMLAYVISPDHHAQVAFISGVFGVLIGADLLHLPQVMNKGRGILSIGGAGVFDGIFLVAIMSALLASL